MQLNCLNIDCSCNIMNDSHFWPLAYRLKKAHGYIRNSLKRIWNIKIYKRIVVIHSSANICNRATFAPVPALQLRDRCATVAEQSACMCMSSLMKHYWIDCHDIVNSRVSLLCGLRKDLDAPELGFVWSGPHFNHRTFDPTVQHTDYHPT